MKREAKGLPTPSSGEHQKRSKRGWCAPGRVEGFVALAEHERPQRRRSIYQCESVGMSGAISAHAFVRIRAGVCRPVRPCARSNCACCEPGAASFDLHPKNWTA